MERTTEAHEVEPGAIQLWEILVPTVRRNDGRPYHLRYHRVWDERVRAITGGLTVLHPAKGTWTSDDGAIVRERMIPVRIACTEPQIREILRLTVAYYDQIEVMAYRISTLVLVEKKRG